MCLTSLLALIPLYQESPVSVQLRLPEPRHGHRVHRIGDQVFVLGGFSPKGSSTDVSSFSLKRKRWSKLPSMQVGKGFFGSALIGDTIYAVGKAIERYRLGDPTWKVIRRDPSIPASHLSAAAIGKHLYILGPQFLQFDTSSGKLKKLAPYPGFNAKDHFQVFFAAGETLHVIGGITGQTFEPTANHWTWRSGKWSRRPNAPKPLNTKFAVVAQANGNLLCLSHPYSFALNLKTLRWRPRSPMPMELAMASSVELNHKLHILGGLNPAAPARNLVYDIKRNRWVN
jgi:hypothetical protein